MITWTREGHEQGAILKGNAVCVKKDAGSESKTWWFPSLLNLIIFNFFRRSQLGASWELRRLRFRWQRDFRRRNRRFGRILEARSQNCWNLSWKGKLNLIISHNFRIVQMLLITWFHKFQKNFFFLNPKLPFPYLFCSNLLSRSAHQTTNFMKP